MSEQSFPAQQQQTQPGLQHKLVPEPETIRKNYRPSGKLKNKNVFITGGDSGIGRSVAVHFAEEGAANIAIICHPREKKDAEATVKMVTGRGTGCILFEGDVQQPYFCKKAATEALQAFGNINILVNNCAVQYVQEGIDQISEEQLLETFQVNIFSQFRFSREIVPQMKEGDSVINTTSVLAYKGSPGLIDYATTKSAITGFTRSLSENLAEKGIRVNAVAPGPVWTPLVPSSFPEEKVKKFGLNTPMGRAGQPSEIGPCFVFLSSEDSSYITGQVLHPNGGWVING